MPALDSRAFALGASISDARSVGSRYGNRLSSALRQQLLDGLLENSAAAGQQHRRMPALLQPPPHLLQVATAGRADQHRGGCRGVMLAEGRNNVPGAGTLQIGVQHDE